MAVRGRESILFVWKSDHVFLNPDPGIKTETGACFEIWNHGNLLPGPSADLNAAGLSLFMLGFFLFDCGKKQK